MSFEENEPMDYVNQEIRRKSRESYQRWSQWYDNDPYQQEKRREEEYQRNLEEQRREREFREWKKNGYPYDEMGM